MFETILAYLTTGWSSVGDFFTVVLNHWVTHLITLMAGWHILPQPGYVGRAWHRLLHFLGIVKDVPVIAPVVSPVVAPVAPAVPPVPPAAS